MSDASYSYYARQWLAEKARADALEVAARTMAADHREHTAALLARAESAEAELARCREELAEARNPNRLLAEDESF